MNYNPNISIKENALNNGVSEAAIRKYIKVHRIDRRYDQNLRKYLPIKKAMEEHPDWSARAIARELGIAPATVCHYKNKGISKREGKISLREAYRCLDFDTKTPIDFMKMEEYDGSKVGIVAFSKGTFKYNGNSIGFGNMRRSPIDFFGHRFECPETAYIACCYGLNNPDCIRIQKEIQASTNGLKCKRQYRYNETDREYSRKDFHQSEWHFNLMLYLVWHKCLKYPDFREMLLAIPDNVAIIENQNGFKKIKVGDWGCKNPEAKEAYNKRLAELKGSGKATEKMREAAIIDTWNVGKWTGCNHQGKILMACRTALRNGTEPCINYQALNDAEIYLFGKLLTFGETSQPTTSEGQLVGRFTKDELFEVCTYNKEDMERPFDNKSILSNFYPFDFTVDGFTFHSAEQYYHWRRLQGYPEYQEELLSFTGERNAWDSYYYIRGKKKPRIRLEKSVKDAIEKDYEIRFEYMREALRYKVRYCKGFKEALLDTGDKIIAEKDQTYSKKDIWAVHKCSGANILGKLLMELRSEIRNQDDVEPRQYTITGCHSTTPEPKRTNANLHKARAAKNDEYYTPLNEIAQEMKHYKKHFKGKTVLCNCDSPDTSNFVKCFVKQFENLGLEKLVAIGFSATDKGTLFTYDGKEAKTTQLKENGDFRCDECVCYLKEADIVVTNPPFSLFREYVKQLLDYGKQFLVIGNKNATTYNDIMTAIKANKLWSGYRSFNGDMWFDTPNGETINVPGCWFTNLDHHKRHKRIELTKYYNENEYPKYDNCDAIEVGKVKDIPCDYSDVMGVPLTFINHYCPEQFEIVGFLYGDDGNHLHLNGKELYFRMLIKLKKNRTNRKSDKMSKSAE